MAANSYLDELTIEQTIIESLLANEKTHPDEIKEKVDTNERKVNNTQIVKIT